MYSARIEEITVSREQPYQRSRTFVPNVSSAQEVALGRPFGFAEISVPRTPQVDELLAGIEAELERRYATGALRPGETPELFFEHAVKRIADGIQAFIKERRLRLGPDSITLLFGCVAGSQVFMTGCGKVNAFLLRRPETGPVKVVDILRGFDAHDGERLLAHLLTGSIAPQDCLLIGNDMLIETVPVAEVARTAQVTEPAGIAASVRAHVMGARPTGSVVGLIARLVPVHLTPEPKKSRSVNSMLSREEEVARVLAPSGIPSIGALFGRIAKTAPTIEKIRTQKTETRKRSVPARTRSPFIERFNALSRKNKIIGIVLFCALAAFLVSLQVNAMLNRAHAKDATYTTAVAAIRELRDQADASFIYDEGRARELVAQAHAKLNALPLKTKHEKDTAAQLTAELVTEDQRLAHIVNAAPLPLSTLSGAGAVIVARGTTLYVSSGSTIMSIDDRGATATVATLTDTPHWMVDDGTRLIAWLKNGTLVAIDPKNGAVTTLTYDGPSDPRDGALWNGRLYALTSDGTQVYKLPTTLSGFGRGSTWLTAAIPGNGANAVALDGTLYAAIPGDAVRQFSKGTALPFAASGSDALQGALRLTVTDRFVYLLGADSTIAVWDKTGKLIIQYALQGANGAVRSFVVNEKQKTALFVTDKGMVGRIGLTHL
jgi:hypothetical protein